MHHQEILQSLRHEDVVLAEEDEDEAESLPSRSARRNRDRMPPSLPPVALLRQLPPVPWLQDYVTRPMHIIAHPR
jgi:hypothetical protein